MIPCLKVKKCEDNNQTLFIQNGRVLLEELVAFSNGRSNPIRHFSAKELLRATNGYDSRRIVVHDAGYELYKGSLEDLLVLVKKYDSYRVRSWANPHKDIAIGSQMSVHKNVLKVLGCCLETRKPTVVYEFTGTRSLSTCISCDNLEPLPWKCRLKIAVELANAIAYLHNAFSRPVIHRDIKSSSILLDQNNVPKLIDFGLCISIPEGQSHVEDAVIGRSGSVAPEYCVTGYLTEKADVYLFGMLLLELLHGQKPGYEIIHQNQILHSENPCVENFGSIVDPRIIQEGIEVEQLLDSGTLFLRCICYDVKKRPTMIELAKELRRIYQSFKPPC